MPHLNLNNGISFYESSACSKNRTVNLNLFLNVANQLSLTSKMTTIGYINNSLYRPKTTYRTIGAYESDATPLKVEVKSTGEIQLGVFSGSLTLNANTYIRINTITYEI